MCSKTQPPSEMFDLLKMNLIAVTLFIVKSYFGEFSVLAPIKSMPSVSDYFFPYDELS